MEKNTGSFYAGNEERYEKWDKPTKVINILEEMNLHPRQHLDCLEATPKKLIEIDDRALLRKECLSVCYGRPHAGEFIPEEIWGRVSEEGKKHWQ